MSASLSNRSACVDEVPQQQTTTYSPSYLHYWSFEPETSLITAWTHQVHQFCTMEPLDGRSSLQSTSRAVRVASLSSLHLFLPLVRMTEEEPASSSCSHSLYRQSLQRMSSLPVTLFQQQSIRNLLQLQCSRPHLQEVPRPQYCPKPLHWMHPATARAEWTSRLCSLKLC